MFVSNIKISEIGGVHEIVEIVEIDRVVDIFETVDTVDLFKRDRGDNFVSVYQSINQRQTFLLEMVTAHLKMLIVH